MGNLLTRPITQKLTEVGRTPCGLLYGVSSMQGWRVNMEDAHICQTCIRVALNGTAEAVNTTKKRKRSRDDGDGSARALNRPCHTGPCGFDAKSVGVGDSMDCSDEHAVDNGAQEDPGSTLLKDHSLFAVFDGHGGAHSAQFSSKNFVQVLTKQEKFHEYAQLVLDDRSVDDSYSYKSTLLSLLEDSMRESFMQMDEELLSSIKQKPTENNQPDPNIIRGDKQLADPARGGKTRPQPNFDVSGTTAVVVLLTPLFIICANAGDSRAVYSTSGGSVTPLSYDHKPNDEYEQFRIVDAGGYVSENRIDGELAVSRALGDLKFKGNSELSPFDQKVTALPDVIAQNRCHEEDEFVLIACDGVWDVQTSQEAVGVVHEVIGEGETNLGMICEELLDLSLLKGSKDNMTAVLVKFPAFSFRPQTCAGECGVTARRRKRQEADRDLLNQAADANMLQQMSDK